jgi:hypothetical protein
MECDDAPNLAEDAGLSSRMGEERELTIEAAKSVFELRNDDGLLRVRWPK